MNADNYAFVIEALSSCAIEGNALAIELLKLRETDHAAFLRRLVDEGWIGEEKANG